MHRRIALGETSSFRYLGIEPPLAPKQADNLIGQLVKPDWAMTLGWQIQEETEQPYTEFFVDAGIALDTMGREVVDESSMMFARRIADLLRTAGDTVEVLDQMITTDFESPIFGADADREREMLASIRTRHQASEL